MPEEPPMPGDIDATALLRDLDGPRPLPSELHQRLTDQLLAAAGDATQVLALTPELSSRLTDELQAHAARPEPATGGSTDSANGVTALDQARASRDRGPGLLAELRSRWTIGTSAAAAVVLLLAAVVGIVFHPGATTGNHAAASGRASSGSNEISSGAPLYPNGNGLSPTTAPSPSSTPAPQVAAGGAASASNSGSTGSGAAPAAAPGAFAGAAATPSPSINSVSPRQGPVTGGTQVTITGEGLGDTTGVHFGSASATSVVVVSSTEVQAVAPAHLPGAVDVEVVTPQGLSPATSADSFTYTAAAP